MRAVQPQDKRLAEAVAILIEAIHHRARLWLPLCRRRQYSGHGWPDDRGCSARAGDGTSRAVC